MTLGPPSHPNDKITTNQRPAPATTLPAAVQLVSATVPPALKKPATTEVDATATPIGAVGGGDHGNVDGWLRAGGWPENLLAQARQVAWCESRWQPAAQNGQARGLFQVWQDLSGWGWFTTFGVDPNDWADPVVNARVALLVYKYDLQHGNPAWGQWVCKP